MLEIESGVAGPVASGVRHIMSEGVDPDGRQLEKRIII